jgi:hypothetical protein
LRVFAAPIQKNAASRIVLAAIKAFLCWFIRMGPPVVTAIFPLRK